MALATALGCAHGMLAAASGGTDEAAALIRKEYFAEAAPGRPALAADRVDEAFVTGLYGSHPDAVKALGRILATSEYWDLNMRIGQVRNRINLEVWASIVADFDIRVELNNAGKMNGAISDLDQTLFCDAEEIVTPDGRVIPRDQVHPFLIEEFERRFRQRMKVPAGRSVADAYDMMHFRGDGMMRDWRMSKSHWTTFLVELDASIEALTKTEGAYFKPGAYKTQVYSRYQNEGTTVVLQKEAGEGSGKTRLAGYGEVEAPPGVTIRGGATKDLSLLYRDVPFGVDRTGALGSVMENIYHGSHVANLIKQAKYGNRWVDTALVHLTNLEVDFRLLMLQGRDGARQHFVNKIFKSFAGKLPPGIGGLEDIQRILEVQQRIELDKVIRGAPPAGQRPKHWSGQWQRYEPRDINEARVKLDYYATEAEEVRRALAAGEALFESSPRPGSPEFEAEVARLAEARFADKLRQVGQMAAARAATKIFEAVFTREGFARQKQLYGAAAAQRLLAERVRELHVALVFADEPDLIRSVVEAAPPEARGAVMAIHDIAAAQRRAILGRTGSVEEITAGELKASNRVLFDLMRRLDVPESDGRALLGADDAPRGPAGPRSIRSFADTHWTDRHVAIILGRGIFDSLHDGDPVRSLTVGDVIRDPGGAVRQVAYKTYNYNAGRMQEFIHTTLPSLFEVRAGWRLSPFGREFVAGFADIGTVDSAARIGLAVAQGDRDAAGREIRDMILGNVPVGNELWGLAKSLKAHEGGDDFPLLMYLTKHGLKLHPEGGPYAAMLGFLVTLYGIEKTIYEFGWWAYGQPTQNEVVSLVLTGERGAVPAQGWESRLPLFRQPETTGLLKQSALLDTHVPIGDLPREYRERMLRAMFLSSANRQAWARVDHNAGRFSDWHVARERTLEENYFQHWRYWFQRMWFYHRVHPRVFAAMGQRAEQPGRHWQGIYDTPPAFLQGVPLADLKAQYPDAWRPTAQGGGSWDHERIHLRRFFEGWINEWERSWREARQEHGEFFSLLDNALIAGDWRKATVDELLKYYIEGEAFYLQNPEEPSPPGLEEARRAARDANARGIREMPDRAVASILNEIRGEGRREVEAIEALYWHPRVEALLRDAIMGAAEETDRAAVEPTLSVRVPRPAVRLGRPVPFDVTVLGDRASLPEDVEISVDYKKVGDHGGRRPEGVLKDDVRIAFGRDLPDEELRVIEHAATVTAASPDGAFRLSQTVPVFWLALKGAEPTDAGTAANGAGESPGAGAQDPDAAVRDGAETAAARAEASGAEAQGLCEQARARASAELARGRALGGELATLLGQLKAIGEDLTRLELGRLAWDDLRQRIGAAGFRVAMLRDEVGQEALGLCQKTEQLLLAGTAAERQGLMAEMERSRARIDRCASDARDAVRAIEADLAKARALEASGAKALAALGEAEARLLAIGEAVPSLGDSGESIRSLLGAVAARIAAMDALRDQVAGLAAQAGDAAAARGNSAVDAAIGRIAAAKNLVRDCPKETEDSLGQLDPVGADAAAKSDEARAALATLRGRLAKAGIENLPAMMRDLEASLETARIFLESIAHYAAQAQQCMAAASRIASRPLPTQAPDLPRPGPDAARAKIRVPPVIGLDHEAARASVAGAGLTANLAEGEPAPGEPDNGKVYAQEPAAGAQVESNSVVIVRYHAPAKPPPPPQEMAPATTPPAGQEGQEFFVVFTTSMAKNLFELLRDPAAPAPPPKAPQAPPPAGGGLFGAINALLPDLKSMPKEQRKAEFARMNERFKNLDMSQVVFEPDPEGLVLLCVRGDGLRAYKAERFRPGAKFATPFDLSFSGAKQGTIPGALLLQVSGCFPDMASVMARFPKASAPAGQSGPDAAAKSALIADAADGTFGLRIAEKAGSGEIQGGPLVEGWPDDLKRRHLAMLLIFGSICSAESAYLDREDGGAAQLATLRRFRDEVLAGTAPGRALVQFYYGAFSPAACEIMRRHAWARPIFRSGFDSAVAAIRATRGEGAHFLLASGRHADIR